MSPTSTSPTSSCRESELMLPEFIEEASITRRVLERVPDHLLSWRPHERSNTIGWNANHLAEIAGWVAPVIASDDLDMTPPGQPPYAMPALTSQSAILELFDRNVAEATAALRGVTDAQMGGNWTLRAGDQVYFVMPRRNALRQFVISHSIHHRAILTVYFRLNNVPVPSVYGPSGDEGM